MQDHIREAIFTLIIIYIFGSIVRKFIIKRKIKCQGFFISVIYTIAIPYRNLLIIFQLVVIGCLLMCSVICRPMAWLIFRGRPVPGCWRTFPVSLCRLSHLLTVFSEQPSCSAIWLTDLPAIDKWIMEPRCAMVRFLNGPVRSMVTSNEAYFAPVKFMTEFMGFHHNAHHRLPTPRDQFTELVIVIITPFLFSEKSQMAETFLSGQGHISNCLAPERHRTINFA